jgi:hypothetical protein
MKKQRSRRNYKPRPEPEQRERMVIAVEAIASAFVLSQECQHQMLERCMEMFEALTGCAPQPLPPRRKLRPV